jgi:signal transduction histidine kinase
MSKTLPQFLAALNEFEQEIAIDSISEIDFVQESLDNFRAEFVEFKLPGVPSDLGALEEEFSSYRKSITACNGAIDSISRKAEIAIQELSPTKPEELLEKQLQRNAGQIHGRIRKWKSEIEKLLTNEKDRFNKLVDDKNKLFHSKASPLLQHVVQKDLDRNAAMSMMEELRLDIDSGNAELFESYIRVLESLTESIDLEFLAQSGTDENDELRTELDRLNSLAQLGITVEILGHELQSYDDMIGYGISQLPETVKNSSAVAQIQLGYEGLTNQLNFLSPLKLSGQKTQKWLSGVEIYEYVNTVFKTQFSEMEIEFSASNAFRDLKIFEYPSRLYPVFINLVNNSRYWVGNSKSDVMKIHLGVKDKKVVISDSGPGVDEMDISKLFSLFFTRKLRGGRGVGLYLAKANLAAGGHKISYSSDTTDMPLAGANFVIDFKGVDYDH